MQSLIRAVVISLLIFSVAYILSGCSISLKGDATVHHVVELDIDSIRAQCEELYPDDQESIDLCIKGFLEAFAKANE